MARRAPPTLEEEGKIDAAAAHPPTTNPGGWVGLCLYDAAALSFRHASTNSSSRYGHAPFSS